MSPQLERLPVLYKQDLDSQRCTHPGCSHEDDDAQMTLTPSCHPAEGLSVAYDKRFGALFVSCRGCGAIAAVFAVADKPN